MEAGTLGKGRAIITGVALLILAGCGGDSGATEGDATTAETVAADDWLSVCTARGIGVYVEAPADLACIDNFDLVGCLPDRHPLLDGCRPEGWFQSFGVGVDLALRYWCPRLTAPHTHVLLIEGEFVHGQMFICSTDEEQGIPAAGE